jgi:hypothetical protein
MYGLIRLGFLFFEFCLVIILFYALLIPLFCECLRLLEGVWFGLLWFALVYLVVSCASYSTISLVYSK